MDSETLIEQSTSSDVTIADYLSALVRDKNNLVTNLQNKGIEVSGNETFTELVPKVASIPSTYAPKFICFLNHPGPDEECLADFAGLNTSEVEWIAEIGFDPNSVTYIPKVPLVVNMNTPKLVNTSWMFALQIRTRLATNHTNNPNGIKAITFEHIDVNKVTSMIDMFAGCTSLQSLDLSCFTTDSNISVDVSGMFMNCAALTSLTLGNWAPKVINTSYMFSGCAYLTTIDLSNFDFTENTDVSYMFRSCTRLTNVINLNNAIGGSVSNCSSMFDSCKALTSLDLSGVSDSTPISSFYNMFNQCTELTELILPSGIVAKGNGSFNTMFYKCDKLTSLAFPDWDTSNASNYSQMFGYCTSLESIDLSSFKVRVNGTFSSVRNMFQKCTSLKHIDLRSWRFSSIPSSAYPTQMFGSSVGVLDIPVDCEIIVMDDTEKTKLLSWYSTLTNIKTVAEYESSSQQN